MRYLAISLVLLSGCQAKQAPSPIHGPPLIAVPLGPPATFDESPRQRMVRESPTLAAVIARDSRAVINFYPNDPPNNWQVCDSTADLDCGSGSTPEKAAQDLLAYRHRMETVTY